MILATKVTWPIIGQIAVLLGWIMDGIYKVMDKVFHVQNLGICIIIFSILIYLFMTPLQIKQQKFSKLNGIMQPEIQKIQKKYAGKKDQQSIQSMNEETKAVYQKYGVSPTGSCLQMAIQIPILFALWQVIYKIPAYVSSVRYIFTDLVGKVSSINGYETIIKEFVKDNKMSRVSLAFENKQAAKDSLVDFFYALSPEQWTKFAKIDKFSGLTDSIHSTSHNISKLQDFLGLNIADQPLNYIKAAITGGAIALGIIAVLIPILSWATQMLNLKLMPQAAPAGDGKTGAQVAGTMKTMNTVMPLVSAFFSLSFPVGLGIYWISSALVRSIQQIIINRHLDKMEINDLIEENIKKIEKKREKAGLPPKKITNQAHLKAKNINTNSNSNNVNSTNDITPKKPGSIAAKANLVQEYNKRNQKNK